MSEQKPSTMRLTPEASAILNAYIAEHPEFNLQMKGLLGNDAIKSEYFDKLSKPVKKRLLEQFPELKKQ